MLNFALLFSLKGHAVLLLQTGGVCCCCCCNQCFCGFTERPCCGAVASAAADDDVGPLLLGPCGGGARNVVAVVAPAGQKNGRQNGRTFDAGKALAVVVVR